MRRRTHEVVNVASPDDDLSRLFDVSVIVLVAGNILAVILESVESLADAYAPLFGAFEAVSVAVFSAELVLRVWVAAEETGDGRSVLSRRLRYLASPMAIADMLAIAPFYLASFFSLDLRFLRFLRLLRVMKLTRYSPALSVFRDVLRAQRGAFLSAFTVLVLMMTFASSAMYVVEHEAQPEAFSSIPAAMWWAVATLTTVGYGDVTPITTLGKLMASSIMIVGIGMVALPTSILASGFTEQHRRRRLTLELEADRALEDGVFDDTEADRYLRHATALGVDPEEAEQIVEIAVRDVVIPMPDDVTACPHCGKDVREV
ncbi:MAG: ion transporter [Myxococcota bacterium]|jgi:voltage-gated potassium channel|nr:ion transporter [Myxococcota bacterium]